jgi:hypothetical protein
VSSRLVSFDPTLYVNSLRDCFRVTEDLFSSRKLSSGTVLLVNASTMAGHATRTGLFKTNLTYCLLVILSVSLQRDQRFAG